jgi:hypothetical protein
LLVGLAAARGAGPGEKPMSTDPFWNRVTLQLIATPAASGAALQAAGRGAPPPNPPEAAFAAESARSWAETMLKPAFAPPRGTAFLAFKQEAGVCDVVRARYKVDRYEIEVAQTIHVIAVRISGGPGPAGASDLARAEGAAKALLAQDDRFKFERVGPFAHGVFGRQDVAVRGRVDAEWPHWVDALHWWSRGGEVGFVTVKATGGPTRALIGPAEDLNLHWF